MALVTAAEVGLNLPGLSSSSTELGVGGVVETLIARADAVLAEWCGFEPATEGGAGVPTLEDTTYTRFMRGSGTRTLQLEFYPLVSVTSVQDDTTEVFDGTTYLVSSSDYTLRLDKGQVLLKQTASKGNWYASSDVDNIKVVYVAGWATVPANMKQAVIQLVTYWYNQRGTLGKQSVSAQGFSYTPKPEETIPLSVRQMMSPYRLLRAWA